MVWSWLALGVVGICACIAMVEWQGDAGKTVRAQSDKESKARFLIEYVRLLAIEFPGASHAIHESSAARFLEWWHSHSREYFKNLTDGRGEVKPDRVEEYGYLFFEKVGDLISPDLAQIAKKSPTESLAKFLSAWNAAKTRSGFSD